jgi:hypothetical protein
MRPESYSKYDISQCTDFGKWDIVLIYALSILVSLDLVDLRRKAGFIEIGWHRKFVSKRDCGCDAGLMLQTRSDWIA